MKEGGDLITDCRDFDPSHYDILSFARNDLEFNNVCVRPDINCSKVAIRWQKGGVLKIKTHKIKVASSRYGVAMEVLVHLSWRS